MCYAYFKYSHWGKEQKDVINIFYKKLNEWILKWMIIMFISPIFFVIFLQIMY
jgi:hypothetical protein